MTIKKYKRRINGEEVKKVDKKERTYKCQVFTWDFQRNIIRRIEFFILICMVDTISNKEITIDNHFNNNN